MKQDAHAVVVVCHFRVVLLGLQHSRVLLLAVAFRFDRLVVDVHVGLAAAEGDQVRGPHAMKALRLQAQQLHHEPHVDWLNHIDSLRNDNHQNE